jgi:hypothetical protein
MLGHALAAWRERISQKRRISLFVAPMLGRDLRLIARVAALLGRERRIVQPSPRRMAEQLSDTGQAPAPAVAEWRRRG